MRDRLLLGLMIVLLVVAVPASAKTVITFWASNSAYQEYADIFNTQSDTIHVEFVHKPRINEALLTAIAGGTPPNVARIDRFEIGQFAIRDVLLPLDNFIERDEFDLSEVYEPLIEELTYKGSLYGTPFHVDTRQLYYNKEVFREVGLDPETPPATWEDLEEYAQKINLIQGRRVQRLGFNPIWSNWGYNSYLWTAGGRLFNEDNTQVTFNSPEGLKALEWIHHFTENVNGGIVMADAFSSSFQGEGSGAEHWAFYSGMLGMIISPPHVMMDLRDFGPDIDYGLATPPVPEGGVRANMGGGFGFAIPKNASLKDESWEFMRFLLSYEGQMAAVSSDSGIGGALSARKDVNMSAEFFQDEKWQAFIEEIPYARFRPVTPVTSQVIDIIEDMVERTVYNKMTPSEALEWAAQNSQQLLDGIQGEF